MRKLKCQS